MKITKSIKSISLTLSNKEIQSIVKNVVLGNSKVKLLKSAQIQPSAIDRIEQWLNALTKRIWEFNKVINNQKSYGVQLLNRFPEYKGIFPLVQKLQNQINATVNSFVDQVNEYDPQSAIATKPSTTQTQPSSQTTVKPEPSSQSITQPVTVTPNITEKEKYRIEQYWIKMIRSNKIKNPAIDIPAESQTTAVMNAWDKFTRGRYKKPTTPVTQPQKEIVDWGVKSPVRRSLEYANNDYLNNKLSIVLAKLKK